MNCLSVHGLISQVLNTAYLGMPFKKCLRKEINHSYVTLRTFLPGTVKQQVPVSKTHCTYHTHTTTCLSLHLPSEALWKTHVLTFESCGRRNAAL